MKCALVSDLHLEFHIKNLGPLIDAVISKGDEAELLVVAGDTMGMECRNYEIIRDFYAVLCNNYKYVVAVAGNHEFWHTDFSSVYNAFFMLGDELPNFIFLNNSLMVIDGKSIYGGTLWFEENEITRANQDTWADFCRIYDKSEIYQSAREFRVYFPTGETDLVISHHLPSYLSVAPDYTSHPENCFYLNNCEDLFKHTKVWAHGHTHTPISYQVTNEDSSKTMVLCNPYGYYSNATYQPLIFDI